MDDSASFTDLSRGRHDNFGSESLLAVSLRRRQGDVTPKIPGLEPHPAVGLNDGADGDNPV